jgi:hypothetical protein
MKKQQLEQNVHYYLENGKIVFTENYHIQRGKCCGSKCRHCPFFPKYDKGTTKLIGKK